MAETTMEPVDDLCTTTGNGAEGGGEGEKNRFGQSQWWCLIKYGNFPHSIPFHSRPWMVERFAIRFPRHPTPVTGMAGRQRRKNFFRFEHCD